MYYKYDWPEASQYLKAFWKGEYTGRALVGVLAPRKTSKLPKFPHLTHGPWLGGLENLTDKEDIKKWWTDPEQNYKRSKLWFENTYFGGEAAPATYINWGASAGCAFWGAEPDFNTKSVWFHKTIEDWDTWKWEFDIKTNTYWQNILSIMEMFVERSNGEYFVGIPEIGNATDNLSLIRGSADLAMDTIMNPEAIKHALEVMSDAWIDTHEVLHKMSKEVNQGGSVLAWLNLWAPGKHDQTANDFSTLIDSATFEDIFFPELRKMSNWLEFTTYHLDGAQCIKTHTDSILKLDSIDCIQFTPGAGSPPTSTPEYIPYFQKMQKAGKKLYLLVAPSEIEFMLENLSAKGVFLNTYADSEEEANEIIRNVEKWSVNRY